MAPALAKKLKASKLIFLSDVLGVMRDPKDNATLIPTLNEASITQLKKEGIISGGMIPKVDACLRAAEVGTAAHMANGLRSGALRALVEGAKIVRKELGK